MTRHSPNIHVMLGAARKAARSLVRDFGEVEQLQVSRKGPGDFVSAADLAAQKAIRADLAKARPGYGFLGEEGVNDPGREPGRRWIVDPLDGTTNFLHGIPHFAISIALEMDGVLVAGVVHDPAKGEVFWAEKGTGAFVIDSRGTDRRLRVSGRTRMEDAVFATGTPNIGRTKWTSFDAELQAVMPKVSGIRRMGSAALDLAYVAAGRYEGYWERNLKAWDIAAGIVLVREAGGYVREIGGGEDMLASGDLVAANDQLHRPLDKLLSQAGT